MTDQETALELGRYIIRLQQEIAALQGVFTEYRIDTPTGRKEIPWRAMAERISQEESYQLASSAQLDGLQTIVGGGTPDFLLIRALHRFFLEE